MTKAGWVGIVGRLTAREQEADIHAAVLGTGRQGTGPVPLMTTAARERPRGPQDERDFEDLDDLSSHVSSKQTPNSPVPPHPWRTSLRVVGRTDEAYCGAMIQRARIERATEPAAAPGARPVLAEPDTGAGISTILRLQAGAGNAAVARMLAGRARAATALLQRNGDAGAPTVTPPAPTSDAGAGGAGGEGADSGSTVTLESYTVAKFPNDQRKQAEKLVAEKGRGGPREFLDGAKLALARATPDAGVPDNLDDIRAMREALDAFKGVVDRIETDVDDHLNSFADEGRSALTGVLDDSKTRAKAEAIKYGISEKQVTDWISGVDAEPIEVQKTEYDMDKASPAGKGMSEAAKSLAKRRREVDALQAKVQDQVASWGRSIPPGGMMPPKPDSLNEAVATAKEGELDYSLLVAEMAGRYPVLGSFSKDLAALERLAAGPSQDAAQVVGEQIKDTLVKIERVREENKPGGGVNIFKLPKIVALTKGRKSTEKGSWQDKAVEEHIATIKASEVIIGIALGLLNLALIALAPATGGASLIAAAGLSTATAVMHAQEYMLEEAMAGSDVDKARALSQEDPSLFWLALDIVGAITDVGAAAGAAAKLIGSFRNLAPLAKAAKVAATTEEAEKALEALQIAARMEGGEELVKKVAKSVQGEGRTAKVAQEVKAVEAAAAAAETELKTAGKAASKGGHVHVTQNGKLFSCSSPCTEMRAKYGEILANDEMLLGRVKTLEDEASKVKPGATAELDAIAGKAADLDDVLRAAWTKVRAEKIKAWLPSLAERFPVLKDYPLDVDAITRIVGKADPGQLKGQLLEELMNSKIAKILSAPVDDPARVALAGNRAAEALEFIPGHRILDAEGQLFTDGMIVIRKGDTLEVVTILEAKAGRASGRGLGYKYRGVGDAKDEATGAFVPLKELKDSEAIEARLQAIWDLKKSDPKKYGKLTQAQIDDLHKAEVDKLMAKLPKGEYGQASNDIERLVELGVKIDGQPTKVSGGRSSTKVVGVLPEDVPVEAMETKIGGGKELKQPTLPGLDSGPKLDPKKQQGLDFATMKVEAKSKDLELMVEEIAVKAAAPTL